MRSCSTPTSWCYATWAGLPRSPWTTPSSLAPRDPFIPCVSSPNGLARFEELGLAPGAPYFTGAMMVVNVDGWRRELVSERALRYVADHASGCCARTTRTP